MKSSLACITLVCLVSLVSSVARADEPSETNIREFHGAVVAGDIHLAEEMVGVYPSLVTAAFLSQNQAKAVPPLLTAIDCGQTKMAAMLLKHGAPCTGKEPINRAAMQGRTEIVRLLLDAGANVDGIDAGNNQDANDLTVITPLRAALECGHIQTARFMVSKGARVDIFSAAGLGWTLWVARQIKEHPEQATIQDGWKYTPLTYAVACGMAGTAEVLLSNGAEPQGYADDNGTFLHMAALNGRVDLMAVLLAHGAIVNAKNDAGETPLDIAGKCKQQDAAATLAQHGGKSGL